LEEWAASRKHRHTSEYASGPAANSNSNRTAGTCLPKLASWKPQ
jgi:hypothetical protein